MNELEGKTVGDYQLLEVLDRKGETFILKGFHAKMNRYAAVKVLSPNAMRNPVEVEEFKRQTELSVQVEHRNILPVWDYGESDGVVYRATRFVESGSLHDHLSWFYDLNKAFGLFRGIGTGLQAIHSKGIVHGNIKPSNVLIDEDRYRCLVISVCRPARVRPLLPTTVPNRYRAPLWIREPTSTRWVLCSMKFSRASRRQVVQLRAQEAEDQIYRKPWTVWC